MNAPARDTTKKEHVGTLDCVLHANRQDPFVVLRLKDERIMVGCESPDFFVRGQLYRFLGRWEDHVSKGAQFRFSTVVRDTPASKIGLIKYLTDFAPNVGTKTAEKLWDKYRGDAVRVLREEPGRVQEDRVMSLDAAKEAGAALAEGAALERTKIDLFTLLTSRGFPGKLIDRAIETWGVRAPQTIQRNPFALLIAELPGAGFKRCDKLYADLGYPADRVKRQTLFLWNCLREGNDGHTWHDGAACVKKLRDNITGDGVNPKKAIALGKRAGWLRLKRDDEGVLWIAESQKSINEADVAKHLIRLGRWDGEHLWPMTLPASQTEGDGLPSEHQVERAMVATAGPVGILCGGPGTGKTHTLAFILRDVIDRIGQDAVAVVAPTGKAAVRATQALSLQGVSVRATTIHRLLAIGRNGHDGKGWGFLMNESNPLPQRVIVVDETSMVDTDLMAALLAACSIGTHVLFIGDPFQLPPVGHGAPLRDLIAAGVPTGELTQVRRNAGQIVHACVRIKNGDSFDTTEKYVPADGRNLLFIPAMTEEGQIEALVKLLGSMRKFDPVWQCQVITGLNSKTGISRIALNRRLHNLLNPAGREVAGCTYKVGDKVICLRNCRMAQVEFPDNENGVASGWDATLYQTTYDQWNQPAEIYVANGEIGRVEAIAATFIICRMGEADELVKVVTGKAKKATDEDEEGNPTDEGTGEKTAKFDLAYAITVHKSQGSEAPAVICMIDPQAGMIADRHFHYTAISRASKLCVLIGDMGVLDKQRLRQSLVRRKTFLVEEIARLKAEALIATSGEEAIS